MSRRPRSKKTEENKVASELLTAIQFISCAQRAIGSPFQTHCRVGNGVAIAFDSVLAAGYPIEEIIAACPQTDKLIHALKQCTAGFSVTQLESNRIAVRSGSFRALVPCAQSEDLPYITPDSPTVATDERLNNALAAVAFLATENSPAVLTASILMRSCSCIATNRNVMLEYWHGIPMPGDMVVPKVAIAAVIKVAKKITHCGFSPTSVTFYFEGGAWIKSQVYTEAWPDVSAILDKPSNPWEVPTALFPALKSVAPFSEDNALYLQKGRVGSHATEDTGATCDVEGLPDGMGFVRDDFISLEPFFKKADFLAHDTIVYFFGDGVRGAMCKRKG